MTEIVEASSDSVSTFLAGVGGGTIVGAAFIIYTTFGLLTISIAGLLLVVVALLIK